MFNNQLQSKENSQMTLFFCAGLGNSQASSKTVVCGARSELMLDAAATQFEPSDLNRFKCSLRFAWLQSA